MTEERALDAALVGWSKHDAGDDATLQRIMERAGANASVSRQEAAPRRWLPMLIGGSAIAASFAIAALVLPQTGEKPAGEVMVAAATANDETRIEDKFDQKAVQLAQADVPGSESFAALYTVSDEEVYFL